MEKKTLREWVASLGFKIVDGGNVQVSDRALTREEFDMILPSLALEVDDKEYELTEEQQDNVRTFFKAAEQSIHLKAWRQVVDEMKGIAEYICLIHKENEEAKEGGTGTGETS